MKMLLQQTNGDLLDPTVANYDICIIAKLHVFSHEILKNLCYWQAFPTFQSYQI
jgi:hypothetical protein